MAKKCVTAFLMAAFLITSTGIAFSGLGFKAKTIGPVVVPPDKVHPWEDDLNKPAQPSSSYSNLDISIGSSPVISTITSLVVRLCVRYAIESALDSQDLIPKR